MSEQVHNIEEDVNPTRPEENKRVRYIIQRPMEVDGTAELYNMTRKKRTAIIFNHSTFYHDGLSRRHGTDQDVKRLQDVLKNFHFTVTVHEDLMKLELLQKLQDIKTTNFNDCDCLAIFVLSHGKENGIAAKDAYYVPDELWKPLASTECITLAGKPKLVFINACRGNSVDKSSLEFVRDLSIDGPNRCESSTYRLVYNIPNNADIFVAYSTYEDYVSHRCPVTGSWFIQALCDVLENENYKNKEIKKILTLVTNKVSLLTGRNFTKQVPVTVSTLMRDLYFLE